MVLNQNDHTISAEQYSRLAQLIEAKDRKGFYVTLYEITGSQAALDMAEISSSSGIRGGTAWAINEYMAKTVPGYPDGDDPVETFSTAIAEATFRAIDRVGNQYIVPSDFQIYLQAHDAWDQVGEQLGSVPNIGDYFPGSIIIAAHYYDVGNITEADDILINGETELEGTEEAGVHGQSWPGSAVRCCPSPTAT